MELSGKVKRYKYNVLVKKGIRTTEESWTGVFVTKRKAFNWYAKFGVLHEANGFNLVFRKTLVNKDFK